MTQILALDIGGMPFAWLSIEAAAHHVAAGKVAWSHGSEATVLRGGFSRTGVQSELRIQPVIAIGRSGSISRHAGCSIPLGDRDNELLFRRDRYLCSYCGVRFPKSELSRDHIVPRSKGGGDTWLNCTSACRRCNWHKGDRMLSECGPELQLLFLPYVPTRNEFFILSGRNVLADQMDYLAASLPPHSRAI
jgi:hypothetical protein